MMNLFCVRRRSKFGKVYPGSGVFFTHNESSFQLSNSITSGYLYDSYLKLFKGKIKKTFLSILIRSYCKTKELGMKLGINYIKNQTF
jgi:hypothetical protein